MEKKVLNLKPPRRNTFLAGVDRKITNNIIGLGIGAEALIGLSHLLLNNRPETLIVDLPIILLSAKAMANLTINRDKIRAQAEYDAIMLAWKIYVGVPRFGPKAQAREEARMKKLDERAEELAKNYPIKKPGPFFLG